MAPGSHPPLPRARSARSVPERGPGAARAEESGAGAPHRARPEADAGRDDDRRPPLDAHARDPGGHLAVHRAADRPLPAGGGGPRSPGEHRGAPHQRANHQRAGAEHAPRGPAGVRHGPAHLAARGGRHRGRGGPQPPGDAAGRAQGLGAAARAGRGSADLPRAGGAGPRLHPGGLRARRTAWTMSSSAPAAPRRSGATWAASRRTWWPSRPAPSPWSRSPSRRTRRRKRKPRPQCRDGVYRLLRWPIPSLRGADSVLRCSTYHEVRLRCSSLRVRPLASVSAISLCSLHPGRGTSGCLRLALRLDCARPGGEEGTWTRAFSRDGCGSRSCCGRGRRSPSSSLPAWVLSPSRPR